MIISFAVNRKIPVQDETVRNQNGIHVFFIVTWDTEMFQLKDGTLIIRNKDGRHFTVHKREKKDELVKSENES